MNEQVKKSLAKRCKKCGEEKLFKDFYVDRQKKDGRRNVCKICDLKYCAIYRDKNREKIRKRDRKKSHLENMTEGQKSKRKRNTKEWIDKNRGKWNEYYRYRGKRGRAKNAVVKLRKKEQPKECSICNIEIEPSKLHGHHPDYDKPFEVVWCCPRCHGRIHRIDNKETVPSKIAL